MLLNREDRIGLFRLKICIVKKVSDRKLMKEFLAKIWKNIALNFLNQLKETGKSVTTQEVTG